MSIGADLRSRVVFRRAMVTGCAIASVLVATSCGAATSVDNTETEGPIVVFAAASLADLFDEIATAFESEFPGTDVQLNIAGTSTLREQILGGAPADVFASADERNMAVIESADELGAPPMIFAHNALQIGVPVSNPGDVSGLTDLANPDLLVGICAEGVPCGDFARQVLDEAGVDASIDTNEGDVRALLTKIEANELDAGIVYATDVQSSSGVTGIDIPDEFNVIVQYPIAILASTGNKAAAMAFVDFVLSEPGQEIVVANGFGPA